MTTSFTRTREQIAAMVLRKFGALAAGGTALSADTDVIYEAIDLRLKEMHELGIFWRKVTNVPVTFSIGAGINTASAGAGDILFPIKMSITDRSMDTPLTIISPVKYASIPNKVQAGTPTVALWDGATKFTLWPVPTVDGTAKLLYEKIADDTSVNAAIDVDVSMIRWIKDIVAYDIGDDFGIPEATMQRFAKESIVAERKIRKLGSPRVAYERVAVDDYSTGTARGSDYGVEGEYTNKGYDAPLYSE